MKYNLERMKLLLIAVVIIFAGVIVTMINISGSFKNDSDDPINIPASVTQQEIKASLSVDYGSGKSVFYDAVKIQNGETAYSLLVKKMNETNISVQTKSYDYGTMVESVNGVASSQTYFWSYLVNGQMGNVSADKYVLSPNDKVEWKYTKIQM